jgi:nucleotide-binding universal stress UspA family protein
MHRTVIAAATEHSAAEPAFALALALARPFGAEVVLAGVVERHGAVGPHGDVRLDTLLTHLDDLAERAPVDVPARVDGLAARSVAHGLHDLALRHEADLLVIAHSDRSGLSRALFGDADAEAVFTAPCGVAFATPDARAAAPRRIGVGWDRTPEAGEALEWAVQLAERTGGDVEIAHVADPRTHDTTVPEWVPDAELERLCRDAGRRATTTHRIAWGDPAEMLEVFAEDRDLLVVGSRARGPVRRTLLGSVSTALLRHAACPVVVLPRGVHVPADTAAA